MAMFGYVPLRVSDLAAADTQVFIAHQWTPARAVTKPGNLSALECCNRIHRCMSFGSQHEPNRKRAGLETSARGETGA